MTKISDKLKKAYEFHNNGKLTDAKNLYLSILDEEPENSQVLDLLGVLYYQVQDYKQSEI